MSSTEPPRPPPSDNNEKKPEVPASSTGQNAPQESSMDTTPDQPPEETWADIPEEIMSLSTDDILTRIRLIDNDLKVPWPQALRTSKCLPNVCRRLCAQKRNVYNMNRTS